jgi:hypothetical protein
MDSLASIVLGFRLHHSYSAMTVQLSWNSRSSDLRFVNDEKTKPDRSSISEVNIYRNNQNMITVVAVLRNNDDDFVSREWNYAYLDYGSKRMLNRCQLFWKRASFSLWPYYIFVKTLRVIFKRMHAAYRRFPIGWQKKAIHVLTSLSKRASTKNVFPFHMIHLIIVDMHFGLFLPLSFSCMNMALVISDCVALQNLFPSAFRCAHNGDWMFFASEKVCR